MTDDDMIAMRSRNLAEVIDDLYRQNAPPRDHARMIDLVAVQVARAIKLGIPIGQQREQRRSMREAQAADA